MSLVCVTLYSQSHLSSDLGRFNSGYFASRLAALQKIKSPVATCPRNGKIWASGGSPDIMKTTKRTKSRDVQVGIQ
ncbi:hypothetical protein CDAR_320681 [Caerostris darwini]|uniref:Uncharacterized protein n=1 Tax=Caerostris darwini TaxID=1538125 RepID=A0AAV4WY77_9ARAC|nr:hypothetical protein CDAR_320681 [Caerostris darwini]